MNERGGGGGGLQGGRGTYLSLMNSPRWASSVPSSSSSAVERSESPGIK